jgi:hypothetical protein
MPASFRIAVAIGFMQVGKKANAESSYFADFRGQIEGTCTSYYHPSCIGALFFASSHDRPGDVAGLEAFDLFCPFWLRTRESDVVDIAHASAAMPCGRD